MMSGKNKNCEFVFEKVVHYNDYFAFLFRVDTLNALRCALDRVRVLWYSQQVELEVTADLFAEATGMNETDASSESDPSIDFSVDSFVAPWSPGASSVITVSSDGESQASVELVGSCTVQYPRIPLAQLRVGAPELSTGRMDPRVGSGHDFAGFWRVGSGRVINIINKYNYSIEDYTYWGRVGQRVGSGQTFCRQSRVGSGRVGSTFRRVGSGPRKVIRGQLCGAPSRFDDEDDDEDDGDSFSDVRPRCE